MANETGAMFDEFSTGGLLDDADVHIKSARFANWDYKGKIAAPVLALKLELQDAEGTVHEEYLSAGELRFFVPSTDGTKAIPVGSQTKLNNNTNAVNFLISLMNADTKGDLAKAIRGTDNISVIDGVQVHVVRRAQPKRSGIIVQPGKENQAQTRLEVEKVLAYAGQAAVPVTKAPAAGAAAPAAAGGAAVDIDDIAIPLLLEIVTANGGSIAKVAIGGKVFPHPTAKALDASTRNLLLGRIVKDEFLNSDTVKAMGMQFDGKTVTMAG